MDTPPSDLGVANTICASAQESTRLDYLHEVERMRERILRLEQAIAEAVKLASPALQEVITDLQALRGVMLLPR